SMKHNVIERVNFGLFMDLDDDKEDELKNEIINSYKKYFPEIANVQLYEVFKSKDINLGLYFFNKDIDNLIMKLFLQYNGKIFDYIDEYIDKSPAKTPNIFDKDKAKISIAGQFIKKCTGYANSVIIRDSGYINETNLNNSIECKNIVKFLSKLMDINLV
ncbi:MAG: hypothetical protein HQK91_13360, partial [Nitrospirae bacterium]|nr:hypothetical protein [Nitrospirota bacterium]